MALAVISSDMQGFTRQLGLNSELAFLERAWETVLGPLAGSVPLTAIDRQTVVAETQSSAAFHELTLRKREIVRRLNAHFPSPWIQQLSIRMARYGNGH